MFLHNKNIEMKRSADSSGIKQESTGDLPPSYVGTRCHEPQACVLTSMLSRSVVSDSVIPWTAARQAPLSMGFSRHDTGVGCQALLLGIFPTRGRSGLLHFRLILYCLSYQRIPVLTCSWYQKLRFSQAAHLYLQIWIILSCLICLT